MFLDHASTPDSPDRSYAEWVINDLRHEQWQQHIVSIQTAELLANIAKRNLS